MGGSWVSALLSDNLLLFAWNLTCLLMLSVAGLFFLICRKHYQRRQRYRAVTEIDRLLKQMTDPELFNESNVAFHERLRHYYDHNYVDLLYTWTRQFQKLTAVERDLYCNNSARCGLFDHISENLNDRDSAKVCISLEVCGLARMTSFAEQVMRYSWAPTFAPYACHALVRMNFDEGMPCVLRAYGHQLISNAELISICTEFSKDELTSWATQTAHWPLPEVLHKYWVSA